MVSSFTRAYLIGVNSCEYVHFTESVSKILINYYIL